MKNYRTNPEWPHLVHYETIGNLPEEFRNPTGNSRPRMRWWLPSAMLSMDGIEKDIRSMAEAGFSGAEVVPMPRFDTSGDFTIEWGTPKWKTFAGHILQTAAKYNFTIDFSMTPFWPLALPGITDASDPEQGAQMEADCAYLDGITKSRPYSGLIPVPSQAVEDAASAGTLPRLAAVTCARYTDKDTKTLAYSSARTYRLGEEVLQEEGDPLSWKITFCPEDEGEYVLFGWWEHPSGNKTCQNLQLDHYSPKATERLTGYWEKELIPYFGDDFSHMVSLFIDSLEFQTHLDRPWGFLESFREENQYDLAPYLPAVYDPDSPGCFVSFPVPEFRFDEHNDQIIRDYQEFLTRLYVDNHLIPLTRFCEKYHINMRYQTSYGKDLELAQTAMYVTIPETETLYGGDILDFYRLQAGSMHLSGKQIYSIEASAEMNGRGNGGVNSGNYQQTWGNQLWHIQRAFSCCVNQAVFHGYSYEGYYDGEGNENGFLPGTHWPGYTTMGYSEFSNNWSSCQPNWLHVNHYTDFLARNQFILRQGTGRIDLAVYRQSYEEIIDFNHAVKLYDDDGLLEQNGYTYDFISPSALALSQTQAAETQHEPRRAVLAPDGPAYKALILDNQNFLPYETALRLREFASEGLPVLFVGSLPQQPAFHLEKEIAPLIEEMLLLPWVKQVNSVQEVPAILEELQILPNARYHKRSRILNVCRHTPETDFYYFYNYGDADTYPQAQEMPAQDTPVTLSGKGLPCLLDTWSGSIHPVAAYQEGDENVTISLHLEPNESCVIALTQNPACLGLDIPSLHTEDLTIRAEYDTSGNLYEKAFTGCSLPLENWKLTLEKWSDSPIPSESIKTIFTYDHLDSLVPWKELPGQENASGTGIYETSFILEKAWEDNTGYVLKLGEICDSFSLMVNHREIPANQSSSYVDISPFLHRGENTLTITIASTLLNALLDYTSRNAITYHKWQDEIRVPDAYGLWGEVYLLPYEKKMLSSL